MAINRTSDQFEHAVRAYSADLFRYAYWLCRDRHLAEDVVQEAFARAWQSWAALRDVAQAKAWLITIVRHEYARTFARKRLDMKSGEPEENDLPVVPSFEAGLETWQIVGLLPEIYREPLLLQVLGGFSCAEIGEILGASEGAIMTRLTRARQALRQKYVDTGRRRNAK